MKKRILLGIPAFVILLFLTGVLQFRTLEGSSLGTESDEQASYPDIPRKGAVTMLDLGADKCIPCKMMAPIIEKLKKDFNGKADIIFIDVWKDPRQAERFRISSIPTQIFYDRDGKEVYRHVGFLKEEAIVDRLKSLGVE